MAIKSIDAADYSERIGNTHLHGGKPAFATILQDIEQYGVSGSCRSLRILWQKMSRDARDHGWLEDNLYRSARKIVLEAHRRQARERAPDVPSNILECLC